MKQNVFGRTGSAVSEIGFGAWAIGGAWGDVSKDDAKAALHAALDSGVTFLDTADVYGDGRSEQLIAEVLKERGGEKPYVATKLGRRLSPHVAEGYSKQNLTAFVDRSLTNLQTDCLDLVQLHCPPPAVYYQQEVFGHMDDLVKAGKIRHYGVSVEKVEEALKAIEYPNVQSIQIIYNIFRQRPAALFFAEAKKRQVGVIARVPLSSGLLTGKMSANTAFAADDHRAFNRNGEAFDKGETFSGVPYDVALEVVEEIRKLVPANASMAEFALRWILMEDAVSTVIPGARNAAQAQANSRASALPALPAETMAALREIYRNRIAQYVHHSW
ncbi:Predicted oxidoreductase [Duganella sp. CF402]|uniref:aldo/keto reductase n=1 Tax=unclassified Duganella TaxID=2636909 RepID=UPI0008D27685|nr:MULTISPECIES: aldo/keto reductase [unclassified Duganella]RZT03909.1 aryl-alcohol dehydrogenase-like predicted oxidoreductase [Duganella sp. BK701]SEM55388.1 Predicted oxidoreductase [Duganella sp. CF402]